MIFQDVIQVFEVLKKKRFSLPEDNNRIDGLGMLGIGWWGVDEMIRWLIKIIYNMSWHFICFLLSLNDWRVDFWMLFTRKI